MDNETEFASCPKAEAVRGYMRDRTHLLKQRDKMNPIYRHYDRDRKQLNDQVAEIDSKVAWILQLGGFPFADPA